MSNKNLSGLLLLGLLLWFSLPNLSWAQFDDGGQHDVKFIVSALESPIPENVVAGAREFDDELMLKGEINGEKIYLISDERSRNVNTIVLQLLSAIGQENTGWVVRVLDTKKPNSNAFVVGGKYVYVFSGLLKEAESLDELVFVLSHELGHSLLKHGIRRQEDSTDTLAGIVDVIAALSGNREIYEAVTGVTKALRASYSRMDEEEADALATAIMWKVGLDPLRGADFFTRSARRMDEYHEAMEQLLPQRKADVIKAQGVCQNWQDHIRNSMFPGQAKINKANAVCQQTEEIRLDYNKLVVEYNNQKTEEQYSSHPYDRNRIAAIAMLSDYLHGRRPIESLESFLQSYRVMLALKQMDSVLLKPLAIQQPEPKPEQKPTGNQGKTLAEKLQQAKDAREQGLMTEDEYQSLRKQILGLP